jgi:hypothetical protein
VLFEGVRASPYVLQKLGLQVGVSPMTVYMINFLSTGPVLPCCHTVLHHAPHVKSSPISMSHVGA